MLAPRPSNDSLLRVDSQYGRFVGACDIESDGCSSPSAARSTRTGGQQRPVSFSAVAERARVSKTYLYTDADLRKRIEGLRQHGRIRTAQQRQVRVQTDASLKVIIAAKDRQIALLRARVKQLERELALARGQLYAASAVFGPPIV